MPQLLRDFARAGLLALVACSSATTEVATDQDALDAPAMFQRVADDALAAGADPSVVHAYRELGRVVSMHGRVSPVTIVVDGVPQQFLATARQLELETGPECRLPTTLCATIEPQRSVIAWQRSDPRRVVQLTGSATSTVIAPLNPQLPGGAFKPTATLAFFDGTGGFFIGTDGTHRIGDPVTSETTCHGARVPGTALAPQVARCTLAEFTATFSGTLAPASMSIRNNSASGTHTISMTSQAIHGARIVLSPMVAMQCPTCEGGYPSDLQPPIDLRAGEVRSSFTVVATAAEVTFTLSVSNGRAVPTTIEFPSGQQFDFRVSRVDGVPVWTWSADKSFTQALGSRTLAPGEIVTYTATWTPTVKGEVVAVGLLTSSSHSARGTKRFVVP
ncbi:MAG: BsuPI-related putative proteinase inhibitor [Gemmatimonadaceae bacterium]